MHPLHLPQAFSVVETTDPKTMLGRVAELVPEIVAVRTEMSAASAPPIDAMFLAIVDIVELQTHLVVAGERERSLATAAGFNAVPLTAEVAALAGDAAGALFAMAAGQV